MKIISASRRTDIPAFLPEWFMNKIREGNVEVKNPFNNTSRLVSLLPEDVAGIVFWTRNPLPLIPFLSELQDRAFSFYFLLSITGLGNPLERRNPALEVALEGFRKAAELAPVHWRFDPIPYDGTKASEEEILNRFNGLAKELQGHTKKCYISFLQPYRKQKLRFKEINYCYQEASEIDRRELAAKLGKIAKKFEMEVYSCCSEYLESPTVKRGSCINQETLEKITGKPVLEKKHPSRKECNCLKSTDIGLYNTCLHECLYCYATGKYETARRNADELNKTIRG